MVMILTSRMTESNLYMRLLFSDFRYTHANPIFLHGPRTSLNSLLENSRRRITLSSFYVNSPRDIADSIKYIIFNSSILFYRFDLICSCNGKQVTYLFRVLDSTRRYSVRHLDLSLA